MSERPFLLTDGTRLPIAMVGRKIIPTVAEVVALGQRSRGVYCRFVFDEMDRASSRFPDLEARGDPLVSLLSLRDLQAAKRLMINRHGDVLGQIRLQRVNSSRAPDDDPTLTERIN